MKKKKIIASLILSTIVLSTLTPVVKATEVTNTDTSTTSVDASSSSTITSDTSSASTSDSTSSTSTSDSTSSTSTSDSTSSTSTSDSTSINGSSTQSTSSKIAPSSSSSSSTEAALSSDSEAVGDEEGLILERAGILEKIIGADNRFKVLNTKADPYKKIVLLQISFPDADGFGTGVLIGPDTILTAAHNVYDAESNKFASYITAYPAQSGAHTPYGAYEAKDYYIFRNYKHTGSPQYDIAVIKLRQKVDSRIGWLTPAGNISLNERVQVAGYPDPQYRGYSMYTMYGGITEFNNNLIAYQIDTEAGQSGSPVLNRKNQVVGIHIIGTNDFNVARRVKEDTFRLIDHAKNEKSPNLEITSYSEKNRRETQRLYHPGIQRHLYTQNLDEAAYLASVGWNYEGLKFKTAATGKPVYRLYHEGTREHLYSTSIQERNILRTRGWRYEGVAWNSGGSRPVYRLYHEGLKVHLYTADKNESDTLRKRGWNYEGVSFYTL